MPIEIKELHIKVNVSSTQNPSSAASPSGAANAASGAETADQEKADLIEQVMQILQNKKER